MIRNHPGTSHIGPVLDVVVSEDQGVFSTEKDVSSPLHGTAWIRFSSGVAQWARQPSEPALKIERTDCIFFDK